MRLKNSFLLVLLFLCLKSFPSGGIRINEFMAANQNTILNPDLTDFVDWVELYNSEEIPVSLKGKFLTDDLKQPDKWRIEDDIVLQPGQTFIFWMDNLNFHNHTSFKLSQTGEQIGLFDENGMVIDSLSYGIQFKDISFGRFPDGSDNWYYFPMPSPNEKNNGPGVSIPLKLPDPKFNLPGGIYNGAQQISLSAIEGVRTYYTLDGSVPTKHAKEYTSPLTIYNSTVFRARSFQDKMLPSDIISASYIINENPTLPVISLITDPDYLFDDIIGITAGIPVDDSLGAIPPFDPDANFWKDWERPVHIEYFKPNGSTGFSQDAGIKIFGGLFGRQIRQKAFTLFAREKYGDDVFNYQLFNSKSIHSFNRFILRCSSNDFNRTYFRDAMINTLVIDKMDIDYQAYEPALVFINGEFWGLYNIREKTNHFYPENNYGIDSDSIDLIEGPGHLAHGDASQYNDLIDFVKNNDLSLSSNYEVVESELDISEFMNYFITEIYVCNHDWLHQNIKCWKEKGNEKKWRWILYDMDWGFDGEDYPTLGTYRDNSLRWVFEQGESSVLFTRLMENREFRDEFIQRFATHINLTFNPARVHYLIETIKNHLEPEMQRQIDRWGAIPDKEYWNEKVEVLHQFADKRPGFIRDYINETLKLSGFTELNLEISPGEGGWVSVMDVNMDGDFFSGPWYKEIPVRIKAHPYNGWKFAGWEGSSQSVKDEITIIPGEQPMHFRAVFEPDPLPAIVISEIHYNPSSRIQGADELYEFIELVNLEEKSIDLSGYHFTDGIYLTFPTGTYIMPGEYIILACDAEKYLNHGVKVFQFTEGRLSNSGETICLVNTFGELIDQVTYSDNFPWPPLPDGNGPSLELKDLKLDNSIYSSWKPSDIDGGTPGKTGLRTSVSNIPVPDDFMISSPWPNPFSESVTINISLLTKKTIKISIFNIIDSKVCFQDIIVRNPGPSDYTWKPESVNAGIYVITFTTEDGSYSTKLIYIGKN